MATKRSSWRRRAALLLVGVASVLPLAAQPVGDRELQVEAAFLVNFVRYAEWPRQQFTSASDPYVIAVLGSDTVVDTVAAIARAAGPIQGRRIEVKPLDLDRRGARGSLRDSHVVFLHASAKATPRELLRAVEGMPVLTVSDVPGFAAEGGMLGLVRRGRHMAFEANPDAIRDGGVSLSAKVLKLARIRGSRQ